MTKAELLQLAPFLTDFQGPLSNPGSEIEFLDGISKIKQYRKFKMDNNLEDQTDFIGFKREFLKDWIENLGPDCDEIRIWIGLTPEDESDPADRKKFTAVLWPYKNNGPAENSAGPMKAANLGNKHR